MRINSYKSGWAVPLAILSFWLPAAQSFVSRHARIIRQGGMVTPDPATSSFIGPTGRTASSLAALTERQMQFWEDVDTGLADIENFYAKKGEDIDRIRTFTKT
jgi:hypothetical protein